MFPKHKSGIKNKGNLQKVGKSGADLKKSALKSRKK